MTLKDISLPGHVLLIGAAGLFIHSVGIHLSASFFQGQRELINCDAICYGNYQSLRAGLSLLGSILI